MRALVSEEDLAVEKVGLSFPCFLGQCKCKPHVTGRDCSQCEPGFWNLASNKGCEACNCKCLFFVFLESYLKPFLFTYQATSTARTATSATS